jgi:hypothetical protein
MLGIVVADTSTILFFCIVPAECSVPSTREVWLRGVVLPKGHAEVRWHHDRRYASFSRSKQNSHHQMI